MLSTIIDQAADHTVPLSTILRKCLVLASRLKHDELKSWVINELQGYKGVDNDDLPPYRIIKVTAKGHFLGPLGAQIANQPLPSVVMTAEHRWWATTAYAAQGVAAYEGMIAKDASGFAAMSWPADLVLKYQSSFFDGYALNRAWQEIPMTSLVEIIDTVRTKLLQFALELESDGLDVEAAISEGKTEAIKPAVTQIFHTIINGGSPVIGGNAGHSFNIAENQIIVEGDFNSLSERLSSIGVNQPEVAELARLLAAEECTAKAESALSTKMKGWVSGAATAIAKKSGEMTLEVTKAALTAAINSYLGIPS